MDTRTLTNLWHRFHWSLRLQMLVLLADLVTKLAVIEFLEQGAGHFAFLNTWGLGIGWLEHPRPSIGWWFPISVVVVWLVWVAAAVKQYGTFVRNALHTGMAIAMGGALSNSIDVAIDQSGTDWILLVSPWGNQVINIADIAIYCGLLTALIGVLGVIRLKVCDVYKGQWSP